MEWRVTQERYLRERLQRYDVTGVATSPMSKWEEPEDEQGSIGEVREAQGITGAILWSVTRTRPDLMFVASRMSQYATKTPRAVVSWGIQALRYVSSTLELGLEFVADPGPLFGSHSQLSMPRNERTLELYSDASHAPSGGKSIQCTVATWRSSIVAWESTRQPFTTLSSAEAELVSMVHSLQVADSIAPIIEELLGQDVVTALMADSAAALSSFRPGAGSWRNRHLRMRAASARERVEAGTLTATHISGDLQVADAGTKPLCSARLLGLLELVNVRLPVKLEAEALAVKAFGRGWGGGVPQPSPAPSAAALALAVMACLPVSRAQPIGLGLDPVRVLGWVVFWVFVGVLIGFGGLCWFNGDEETLPVVPMEDSSAAEALDSPRRRIEAASSSTGVSEARAMNEPSLVEREGNLSCVFPMVGRVDPRSNWAPAHYFRWLLSLVGEGVFRFLGVDAVEIWRSRALGRTFRYGVAFAFERARGTGPLRGYDDRFPVYDIAQARLDGEPVRGDQGEEEDTAIDDVRHVEPEGDQGYHPFNLMGGGGGLLGEDTDSSQTDSNSTGTGSFRRFSSESDATHSPERGEPGSPMARTEGVSYRAVDGALIVVCVEEEMRIELPGWLFEEVHSIVVSIQRGNWDLFHEVMAMGPSQVEATRGPVTSWNAGLQQGEVALGQEGEEEEGIIPEPEGSASTGSEVEACV